ncbi:flippase [Methanobacterium aggregans]|uniref:flippase n=1 Tax=Methanobacterium aggregans TaxID=1615586 RepID=UPI001AE43856|nr:flippase [Methanobacterium aggregans]MBP2046145.1 O-antigen/teichoic acid export membrane protein [Methanobacterium aggregans]
MAAIRRIAKNTGVLFIAQIITYVLGFFITMYTARYLGAGGFGVLSLALSITGILGVFSDLGLSTLMVRDVARDKFLTGKYVVNLSVLKVFLSVLTFGLVAATVTILGYPELVGTVIYLITLSTVLNAFTLVLNSVFQANEKMEYISVNYILNSVLMAAGTALGIYYALDVVYFASVYVISCLLVLILAFIIYVWKFSLPKLEIDLSFWKPTLNEAWPFGVSTVLANIYYFADSVILSVMVSTEVVGWYNAAYRILAVMLFIPILLNTVLFPVMSQFYVTSKDSFKLVYEKYFKYMAMIGIPIGVGTTLLADKIILLIFGSEYAPSIIALQILIWALVISFLSGAFTLLLQTSNKQMVITKITSINVVLNVVLNLILIPYFSYVGSSVVTVVTQLSAFLLSMKAVSDGGYGLTRKERSYLAKTVFASMIMGIFLFYFRDMNLFALILVATAIYFIVVCLINGFDDEDIAIVKNIINK